MKHMQNAAGQYVPAPSIQTVGPLAAVTTGNNLLTVDNSWLDVRAFNCFSIQIIASAGISAGAIIFEQTNDPALAPAGVQLAVDEQGVITANPLLGAQTIAASTIRMFKGACVCGYIRARVSTTFVGGTVRACGSFSDNPYAAVALNVQQAVAANFNATMSMSNPTTSFLNSAATTNATSVKASAGTLLGLVVSNTSASVRYLKLYNKASAPTVGTDVPVLTIPVPIGGLVINDCGVNGIRFSTGIALAITGAAADTDTTVIAASEVKVATTYV